VVAATVPLGIALIWISLGLGLGAWLLGMSGVVSVAIGLVAATAILVIARRRLGGVTGDVLGATIEIATGAVALSLAVLPSLAF
jgi:adenosylcobinamide-GDP ribazoletransferase